MKRSVNAWSKEPSDKGTDPNFSSLAPTRLYVMRLLYHRRKSKITARSWCPGKASDPKIAKPQSHRSKTNARTALKQRCPQNSSEHAL